MYLPPEILSAQVLITVKTYPLPSNKYDELVCTAGFLPDGKWIRLYPIPFRALPYESQYSKYFWVNLDLVRNTKDFRPESYRPKNGIEAIQVGSKVGTGKDKDWVERKKFVLNEVFYSMENLIERAKSDERKSLWWFPLSRQKRDPHKTKRSNIVKERIPFSFSFSVMVADDRREQAFDSQGTDANADGCKKQSTAGCLA